MIGHTLKIVNPRGFVQVHCAFLSTFICIKMFYNKTFFQVVKKMPSDQRHYEKLVFYFCSIDI